MNSEVLFNAALTTRKCLNLYSQMTVDSQIQDGSLPINSAASMVRAKAIYLQRMRHDLMSVMLLFKSMRASNPRDKGFAPVGVASDVLTELKDTWLIARVNAAAFVFFPSLLGTTVTEHATRVYPGFRSFVITTLTSQL
jgi:hypothetical protein